MIKENPESKQSPSPSQGEDAGYTHSESSSDGGLLKVVKSFITGKQDTSSQNDQEASNSEYESVSKYTTEAQEKLLISNILKLKSMKAMDVMTPRADIVAISKKAKPEELLSLLIEMQYSRIPVYKGTLDNVIGSIHVKDVLSCMAEGKPIIIPDLVRDIPIISPSLHVLDLLLQMRMSRKHMVLVVDEFGGIDGLITMDDVIEAIVGQIDDEHAYDDQPEIIQQDDGTYLADARLDLEQLESHFGAIISQEEKEENDTLGGLIFSLAGRVPGRGEVLTHNSGMVFEIVEADPRRVNVIRISNAPPEVK